MIENNGTKRSVHPTIFSEKRLSVAVPVVYLIESRKNDVQEYDKMLQRKNFY